MPGDGDEVPRLLRDRHIKAVRDKFHQPPTVNELRAIDALPLEFRKNLNDTSPNGQRIYEFLRVFEKTGYVEGLEEAGRLLWAQIFAEPDFSQEPRREPFSAVRIIAACGISEVKYRSSQHPTRIPKEEPLQWRSAEKVISINATSNAFAGSPQKPWMTRGISISPTPRRASISSVENDNKNESASYHSQSPDAQPFSLRFAQFGQQPQNHTSTFTTAVPGCPPNTNGGGVYTPWPLHQKGQEHQYASPYSTQASTTSMPYVPKRREPARDMISRANIPSNIDGESRVPVQQQSFNSNYTPNWKSESTDSNTSMGNSLHAHPFNDAGYQKRHITSSTGNKYDPTSPHFHPAISAGGQQLYLLRKEEEENELARITSNTHHSLSTLRDNQGDQQTESSSTVVAANALSIISTTGHRTQLATPNSSSQQSPSSDTSAVAPGQSSNNPFFIRDDMGFIRTFQPESGLSISSSTTTPIVPSPKTIKGRTAFPDVAGPQFGISIPENPLPGTIFSTRTQYAHSVHNAKKNSTKKEFIPTATVFAQLDGTSDSASNTDVQAHYIPDLPPQQESFYSIASPHRSIELIHFDPMKDYDKDDDAYTEDPISVSRVSISHPAQPPYNLFHPIPTRPSPPPPHLRLHTPEYLLFPPTAASSSKQIWPPPRPEIDGYHQYTFVRDRISFNMKAKRRTEIDLDTGEYRYGMDSKETSRGYKMDGTRIRTSSRYFHKKRIAKRSKEKVEEERVDEIVRKVESVDKRVEEMRREERDALLGLLGGGFLPL
ncbi:uncharacterized protein Bfra_001717 [Botrytis fragariae]|uniref:Uncharacterized protein n=1 Tax=Botrytis fragariae TaxID=1964551 RepID=A0A8H6EMI3_9HELO|nr:uncharacterized protein Bfra_001717 [Botrytis fragariae]KAF5877350.1 hypothetical protein Bfra_001717 [Botrytis fragariae]